jgi:hypothetical protein
VIEYANIGFSYCDAHPPTSRERLQGCNWDDAKVANALLGALRAFFGLFPAYAANDFWIAGESVRAALGRLSAITYVAFSYVNRFCMGLLYGRAGRLNTKNAGFRPGQYAGILVPTTAATIVDANKRGGPQIALAGILHGNGGVGVVWGYIRLSL